MWRIHPFYSGRGGIYVIITVQTIAKFPYCRCKYILYISIKETTGYEYQNWYNILVDMQWFVLRNNDFSYISNWISRFGWNYFITRYSISERNWYSYQVWSLWSTVPSQSCCLTGLPTVHTTNVWLRAVFHNVSLRVIWTWIKFEHMSFIGNYIE